jgi:hypothetical protein
MNFAFKLAVYQSSPMSLRQIQQRAVLFLAHKLQWFITLDLTPVVYFVGGMTIERSSYWKQSGITVIAN